MFMISIYLYFGDSRLARGDYSAKIRLVDDDGKVHLDLEYLLEIAKEY